MISSRMQQKRLRFHVSVVVVVLIIVVAMAAATVSMVLSVARRNAATEAAQRFELISTTAREKTFSLLQPAMDLAEIAAFAPSSSEAISGGGLEHPVRQLFTQMLKNQPAFYSAYIGFDDGTFVQVIHAEGDEAVLAAHAAPAATTIILRTITGEGAQRLQDFTFIGSDGEVLSSRRETDFDYDPRVRPWYGSALENDEPVLSRPYVFNSLGLPGITASRRIPGGTGVVGVDLTISSLTTFVSGQEISPNGGVALYTGEMDAISASPGMEAILEQVADGGVAREDLFAGSGLVRAGDVLVGSTAWRIAANRELVILTAAPQSDFMTGAIQMRRRIILLSALVMIVIIPLVFLWARQLSRALKELAADAERVSRMDFGGTISDSSRIYEFWQLARAFAVMKETIADRTQALEQSNTKLEMLVDMSIAMSAEFDIRRLSEMILRNAKKLTHADGGSLYLVTEGRRHLEFQIVLNDSLGFEQGGTSGKPVSLRPVSLYEENGDENHHNVVTHTFHAQKTVNIPDAYEAGDFDFSGTREFDAGNGYRSTSFLTVPLKPRGGGEVLGALQLINAQDPETGEIIPFSENYQGFVEALSSAAAVAVQNWKLMEQQKRLFDELVHFVASAIDGKSPYTARHCERVPRIALMLAEAAQEATTGSLANFSFETTEQKREFEIAAWLHDCGKVTTPEYIVDKATKLETIYNRIHEIRTRFEVLLRDATIQRHREVLAGGDPERADRMLAERSQQLHDDFAFVAECNVGDEYLGDAALARLVEVGSTPWLRHFDNRLGLSWVENRRYEKLEHPKSDFHLPSPETLLDDRPEHIVSRENWTQEKYNNFGFRLAVPDHLYNRGELYNLSVRSGTLTEEDRFKINEHAAQTIVMLDQIGFPDDLKRVMDYAGSHHESPDGTGYPRGLTADQLSVPAKIMAIADIFEALASTDRPYKRDKKLSEIIETLAELKDQGRIDRELFEVFISSGVFRRYAEQYLEPEQLDEVDISRYVNPEENQ